jgi:hypothetical protein
VKGEKDEKDGRPDKKRQEEKKNATVGYCKASKCNAAQ